MLHQQEIELQQPYQTHFHEQPVYQEIQCQQQTQQLQQMQFSMQQNSLSTNCTQLEQNSKSKELSINVYVDLLFPSDRHSQVARI